MPVILITDAFFFVLIGFAAVYAMRIRRHPHLAIAWRKLVRKRSAVAALVFLAFYFLIALLDSMHFKPVAERAEDGRVVYSTRVISVLDLVLQPLKERTEKTYSEPLATHAYVKEIMENERGELMQGYPRLAYGGRHLEDAQASKAADVAATVARSLVLGFALTAVLFFAACGYASRRRRTPVWQTARCVLRGTTDVPWRVMLAAFLFIVLTVSVFAGLSADYHVFGTDKIGQDVLYQAVKSIRTGFLIGTLTTLIMLPFALMLGISAGYFLGWIDDVIQYLYTTLNSIPGVLLIAAAVLMLHLYMDQNPDQFDDLVTRADTRLIFLCAILGITSWTGLCRLLRAETLKVKEIDYVEAARALGASRLRVILRHIAPNVMHIVFITIALDFSGLVLAEVVLSYVNIGVDPTMHSWGNMINGARLELAREPVVWWPLLAAMVFLFVFVLCANLFADGIRDAFDPKLEHARTKERQ